MAAAPPVTVITTTFNWPSALALAMRSALDQSFGDFEYLILGDCCTDETEAVVRAFGDPRIRWRNLDRNTGNQSGVNRVGLEMARGGLIAYLNHDDLWFPDHLEVLTAAMRARDLDIVNTLAVVVSPPGSRHRAVNGLPFKTADGRTHVHANTTCVMHTAEAASAVGGWRDWRESDRLPTQDFFQRLRDRRARFEALPEVTALKFHSADRPNSYVTRTADEQRGYYDLMQADAGLRLREVLQAMVCQSLGEQPPKIAHPAPPEVRPPGWQIEQWRRIRGLEPMLDLAPPDGSPQA